MRSALAGAASWIESWTWSSPRSASPVSRSARQRHARGDEVGVEAGGDGGLQDLLEILAHCRLPAGEVDLQHAERAGLAHYAPPLRRRQLGIAALHAHNGSGQ